MCVCLGNVDFIDPLGIKYYPPLRIFNSSCGFQDEVKKNKFVNETLTQDSLTLQIRLRAS